jgi:hypothetical protein
MRSNGLGGTTLRDNNLDVLYKNLMEKYRFGGAERKDIYFDEENRRHLLNIRTLFAEAAGNLADAGKKEEAIKVMNKIEASITQESLPYAMVSRYNSHNQSSLIYLEAAYKTGMKELAAKVKKAILSDLKQQESYYNYIQTAKPAYYGGFERTEAPINERLFSVIKDIETKYEGVDTKGK